MQTDINPFENIVKIHESLYVDSENEGLGVDLEFVEGVIVKLISPILPVLAQVLRVIAVEVPMCGLDDADIFFEPEFEDGTRGSMVVLVVMLAVEVGLGHELFAIGSLRLEVGIFADDEALLFPLGIHYLIKIITFHKC